jgi:TrmH family RNA methyltransferase
MNSRINPDITSNKNPRIKFMIHLRKKCERDRSGLIAIEGTREIEAAIEAGVPIRELFYCPGIITNNEELALLEKIKKLDCPLISVSDKVYSYIAYRSTTGGLVALAENPGCSLDALPADDNPLYLVADKVEKPGNVGALFRTADAAGVTGLIASDLKTDLFNPNIIRSSLGTVFTVPSAETTAGATIDWLKSKGIRIIVSSPGAGLLYTTIDFTLPCAIVAGSEDQGLGGRWFEEAEYKARIPMRGKTDSLNVSVACAILIYEALRQRTDL